MFMSLICISCAQQQTFEEYLHIFNADFKEELAGLRYVTLFL